ncbi:hypothetical protein PR202_gb18645 [Eleusine coracana subsp. coracana]|uniref:Pentatricopeptide repeat-containing protein-mitochondrial domain-containing protein n=1 Tax=Eleusine coracana subsp. coracana TaxID=191504 RepID=A0AAV5F645_ELECO|nr:hypothetical protein PR202_gb18645 [Eleusine coracana subsp. coracana]
MALAAARRRLWRGMGTAAAVVVPGTDVTLLSRLVSDPECQVKATMEMASSSASHHRDGDFWEPLAAALLRASYPAEANLVSPSLLVPRPVNQYAFQIISCFRFLETQQRKNSVAQRMHITSISSLVVALATDIFLRHKLKETPMRHWIFFALNQVLEWKLEKLLKERIHDCKPYSTIIRFCGETRNATLAMRVFECMEAQGIQLNTGIFNALINAFLSVGDLLSAITLYESMESIENCKPDSTTYDAFISAFSLLGSGHAMMNWYLVAKNAGFTPSTQTFECLITGFVRLNMLDDAETMFKEMISFEIKPNNTILEAKLEMLCRRKEANLVREFFKYASDGKWELNDATVKRLTRAILDGGDVDEMEELLALIQKEAHVSSETQLHSGIIKSYAKADRLADMERAIWRMLDNGTIFLCLEDVEAVICCYFRHKNFDRLDLFLNRIQSLFNLTRSTYDILVAGYRRFGLHERLDSTVNDMKKAGFA